MICRSASLHRSLQALVLSIVAAITLPASAQSRTSDADVVAAAKAGDLPRLKALLAGGGLADAKNAQGIPATWAAVTARQGAALEALLEAGATGINEPAPWVKDQRWTLLKLAAASGQPDMVRALLKHHADSQALDELGQDVLANVAVRDSVDTVNALLEGGADPNRRYLRGMTALQMAARRGPPEIIAALLAHGADPGARDDGGITALMHAVGAGREDVAILLLDAGAAPYPINVDGASALSIARSMVKDPALQERLVKLLIARGAPADGKGRPVDEAFLAAAAAGNVTQAKAELARGADLLARRSGLIGQGDDALNGSVRFPAMVTFLLDQGINTRILHLNNFTPLHAAASAGNLDSIRVLSARGGDVNARSKFGTTPLSMAIFSNTKEQVEVVRLLLQLGADPNLHKTSDGKSLVDVARSRGKTEIAELLVGAGGR